MSGEARVKRRLDKELSCSTEIIVPFHDVDVMGIVWHGHYVKYFEIARCALLAKFNYSYEQMKDSGYAWPVIDMRVRYPSSARFEDRITVVSSISEWDSRLKVDYEIYNSEGQRLTRGYTVQVAVDMTTGEMCFESPPVLLEHLGVTRS